MTTPDTTSVRPGDARGRFIDRLAAIADAFQDWLTQTPVTAENAADRDVMRNGRDLAEALQDMLAAIPASSMNDLAAHVVVRDAARTITLLNHLADGYGVTIPGKARA